MNRKNIVKFGLVVLVALLLAAIPLLGACAPKEEVAPPEEEEVAPPEEEEVAPPEEEKWVKVGISYDLSGPLAATHTACVQGKLGYVKMVNDEGGIAYKDPKTGKTMHVKIDAMWADDGYNMDRMLSNYTRFKDAGMIVFLQGSSGGDVILYDIASKDKMPVVHGGDPGTMYPRYPGGSWIVAPTGGTWADGLATFVNWVMDNWTEDRAPKLGIITVDVPFGTALITDASLAYMEERGMEYVGMEFYLPTDVDVIPQLTRLDDKGADWVFHQFVWETYCMVLKTATDLGLKDHINFCANGNLFSQNIIDVAGPEVAEGAYGLSWYSHLDSGLPGVELMKEWILKKYPDAIPSELWFSGWHHMFTVCGGIKAALEEVGYPITGEDFMNALYTKADGKGMWADTGDAFPPIDYTSNPRDAGGTHQAKMLQMQSGKVVEVTDWLDIIVVSIPE